MIRASYDPKFINFVIDHRYDAQTPDMQEWPYSAKDFEDVRSAVLAVEDTPPFRSSRVRNDE